MTTGIELITEERQEQIEKHGYTKDHDKRYVKKELVQAAEYCLSLTGLWNKSVFWPPDWDNSIAIRIAGKSIIEQLAIAGAFLMAENDRRGDSYWEQRIINLAAEIDRLQNINPQ
jgi:hypothetical protein